MTIAPRSRHALSQPLPTDPKQLHDLWDKLTPEEKDWLYSQNHNIGNDNGMATDDRDHYNRLNLADQVNSATAAAARADALKAQHPDWAQGKNIPSPNEPGAIFDDRLAYEAWQRQYDAARDQSKYLPDLQAVSRAVQASPDRKLMLLDTQSGKQARAAIAVGDPDKSTHVSVTVPGLNTTVHGAIEGMTSEATDARKQRPCGSSASPPATSTTACPRSRGSGMTPRRCPDSTSLAHRWPAGGASATTTSPAQAPTTWLAFTTEYKPLTKAGLPI